MRAKRRTGMTGSASAALSPRASRVVRNASLTLVAVTAILAILLVAGLVRPTLDMAATARRPAFARRPRPAPQVSAIATTPRANQTSLAPPATSAATERRRRAAAIQLLIPDHPGMTRIPPSFLGISTEYWTVPMWARHLSLFDRVLSLIRTNGSVQLRIGGSSADQVVGAAPRRRPRWMFLITRRWLAEVGHIVRRADARVIFDLNTVTASVQNTMRWARLAVATLPPRSILGFEIGNEPDIYSQAVWERTTLGGRGLIRLPDQITSAGYDRSFGVYAHALGRVAPDVALLGPALSQPRVNLDWISTLIAGAHPGLGAVTVHRYPLSACSRPGTSTYPTIARVLSDAASRGVAQSVRPAVRVAARAGLPVRVTELNSVTCGGVRDVSRTFATALWAPDALFALVRAGVASVDIHVRADAANAAFTINRHGLTAHPLLYGMIMFARTLGHQPRLVHVRLRGARRVHMKAWAVRDGGMLHVLLIDKGSRPADVDLHLPVTGNATVQRLQAPSVRSGTGVTLGGQWLDARGQWEGTPVVQIVHRRQGGFDVRLGATSAALLTFHLQRGALPAG